MRTMGKPGKSTAPRKLSDEQVECAATMRELGETYKQIGDCLGVSRDTVRRALRRPRTTPEAECREVSETPPVVMAQRNPLSDAMRLLESHRNGTLTVQKPSQPEVQKPWWRRAVDQLREAWETLRAFVAGGVR